MGSLPQKKKKKIPYMLISQASVFSQVHLRELIDYCVFDYHHQLLLNFKPISQTVLSELKIHI